MNKGINAPLTVFPPGATQFSPHLIEPASKKEKMQQFLASLTLALKSLEYMLSICERQEEKSNLEQLLCRIQSLLGLSSQFIESTGTVKGNEHMLLPPSHCKQKTEMDQEFIHQLIQVIEKNFPYPDFNVEELAKKLNISEATLYRKVYAITGETPCEFIRSFRLQRAAQLLECQFGSVMDVAFEVGFNSHSYFTKCFREKFGRLPSHF
jgi:AraC-like DNA-binding protein